MNKIISRDSNSRKLDFNSLNELVLGSKNNDSAQQPSLIKLRDMMGWPAKDITSNDLIIEDRIIKGHIPTRFYRKTELLGKKLPVLVYIHGGGFFGGSINNVEQICRTFADREDILVVSVGYRLAPEHPFPAGLLDCYHVVESLATTNSADIHSDQIFIAGDSAGGNLGITVSLLDNYHLQTHYIKKIVAFYPVTTQLTEGKEELWDVNKFLLDDDDERTLVHNYIKGFAKQDISVIEWYTQNRNRSNPLISPLHATTEMLQTLPPLKIITGEFDPLRLQGEAFIDKLTTLNLQCEYSVYDGMVHAFIDKIGDYPQAETAIEEAIDFLRK